jgi:hypothetical protein
MGNPRPTDVTEDQHMSEPSSNIPEDIANADVDTPAEPKETQVELSVDEDKLGAWNAVKSDYQVEPHGQPVANSMGEADTTMAATEETDDESAETEGTGDDSAESLDDESAEPRGED